MIFPINNITYLYRKDFGDYEALLAEIADGSKPTDMLASILSEVTGDQWVVTEGPLSVKDAKVVYYGANNRLYPTNSKFKQVMIVELSEASHKLNGKIYLQMHR